MKKTDRELNELFEDVTAEIRTEKLEGAVVSGASQRVWTRLAGEQAAAETGVAPVEQLRGCEDFQALIPAYMQGTLSAARTMLLEDHTRECVPCRRALKEARQGNQVARQLSMQKDKVARSAQRMTMLRWGLAAAAVVVFGLMAWPWIQKFTTSVGTLHAIVEAANGNVYRVTDNRTQAVKIGEKILKGEHVRTAKGSAAVVRLSDGSAIEMQERSEFAVTENVAGVTVNLERGKIIVEAAKQKDRKLFVATDDALVAVTGTIFSVNHGTKGARVSVVEGEVNVEQAGRNQALRPGDQVTTHQSVERVPVQDEIAWSRNADKYKKLLEESLALRKQIDQMISLPGNRYSTQLLELMPENTAVYVAIPNITTMMAEANRLLEENVGKNPELQAWWEQEQARGRRQQGFNKAIEFAKEFGNYLGTEVAFGAEIGGQKGTPEQFLLLAELRDGQGLRAFIENKLQQLGEERKNVVLVDDPMSIPAEAASQNQLFVWIRQDILAASPRAESLQRLATRINVAGTKPFAANQFCLRIADLYREGAGLVVAADLERLMVRSMREDKGASAARQLGLTDLRYFMVELKEKEGRPYNRAVVSFQHNEHGITSWLAEPGPMGALEFISPNANIVAAFVVKEPTAIVDDLFNTLKSTDPKAWEDLQKFQAEQGIDLREDLAAPLGGEYAFAIDGPILPLPSWKAVFEVDDPARLQQTLETIVAKIDERVKAEGKLGFAWSKDESGDRIFYKIKSLDFALEVDYAFAYGYMIAGPSRALVENAIKYKESGNTLLQSAKFKATLPEDRQANFSAMVYQNLESIANPLSRTLGNLGGDGEAPKAREAMKSLLNGKAGLVYVYALEDRMIFSVNSEDGPIGLSPSDFLGLPGSTGLGGFLKGMGK